MKQKKSDKQHSEGGTIDPELDKNLEDLVKMGLMQRFTLNGQVIYGITPQGDAVAEKLFKKEKKTIDILP